MSDEASIVRQLQRERAFQPPYCPNEKCSNHLEPKTGFHHRYGSSPLARFPYRAIRFQCKDCRKTFNASCFRLHHKQKVWGKNKTIFTLHSLGISKREIGRQVKLTECGVRGRIIKMARWALLKHASLISDFKIEEAIVYDGLENFSFSQYDPNNLNHTVGKESLFTYDFNLTPINRKGRMSDRQVLRKEELDRKYGAYAKDGIRSSTKRIFARLIEKSVGTLLLYSDRHFQYRRVLEWDLPDARVEHVTICSKIARNFKNPLFAVNNIDLQARHNLAAFKRETIAFAKHTVAMQEAFVLYMVHRNYMRPKFWGTHRSDPASSKKSPAMELKLTKKILTFEEFFDLRPRPKKVTLCDDWQNLYDRRDPLCRRPIRAA